MGGDGDGGGDFVGVLLGGVEIAGCFVEEEEEHVELHRWGDGVWKERRGGGEEGEEKEAIAAQDRLIAVIVVYIQFIFSSGCLGE